MVNPGAAAATAPPAVEPLAPGIPRPAVRTCRPTPITAPTADSILAAPGLARQISSPAVAVAAVAGSAGAEAEPPPATTDPAEGAAPAAHRRLATSCRPSPPEWRRVRAMAGCRLRTPCLQLLWSRPGR